jgi:hypothetical protein
VSLIDEALKRAEMEAARRDGLRTGASPWVMESRPRRGRGWILAGVAVVVLAAAAGAFLWLARGSASVEKPGGPAARGASPDSRAGKPQSAIAMDTVEVPTPPAVIKPRDPGHAAIEKALPKTEQLPPPTAAVPAAAGPARKSEAPGAQPAPAAERRSSSPPPESKAPRGLANGRTYVGEVSIPDGGKIALEGIVFSETNPVALINGKVLPPGAVVEEFTISSIQPDRVEFKGRGITIFVALK